MAGSDGSGTDVEAGAVAGGETRRKRRWPIWTGAALFCGVVVFLLRESLLQTVGDWLIVQDQLQPADVIHVISGPDNRTEYALQLYHRGLGKQLFFTGGWCPEVQGVHAERGERLARADGVPASAIAGDGAEVHSTYSEAVRLKAFIDANPVPIHSVILVSDPFHMRRARWAYEHVLGPEIRVEMAPLPFAMTPFQRQWWKDEKSRRYVWEEYVKSVYYYARY